MKIFIVIRDFFSIGGAENFAREFVLNLKKRNVKIKVITTRNFYFKQGEKFYHGVRVIQLYTPRVRILGTIMYYLSLSLYLASHYTEYDIIQSFFLKHSSFISIILGKLFKKKVFCRVECSGNFGDLKALKKVPFSFIFFNVFKKSKGIIVLSKEMRKELEDYGFNRKILFLIPNGVNVEKFKPSIDKEIAKKELGFENRKIVIFVGRLNVQKGLEYLLEAFRKIDISGKLLIILGEGTLKEKLQKRAEEIGINDKVWFGGNRENVVPYLQASDVFVLPSLSEGLPIALLEAMACGLPVIVSKVGGNIDIVENEINGYIIEPRNTEQIKIYLEYILKNKEKADLMSKRNREKIVENYSCEVVVEKYLKLYSNYQ